MRFTSAFNALSLIGAIATLSAVPAYSLHAQAAMDHSRHAAHSATSSARSGAPAGQDAFAAIADVVAILEADSTTDWTKVDIAALRRHLQAMNDVTLHATAAQAEIPGGARVDVTGDGRVIESIRS